MVYTFPCFFEPLLKDEKM